MYVDRDIYIGAKYGVPLLYIVYILVQNDMEEINFDDEYARVIYK